MKQTKKKGMSGTVLSSGDYMRLFFSAGGLSRKAKSCDHSSLTSSKKKKKKRKETQAYLLDRFFVHVPIERLSDIKSIYIIKSAIIFFCFIKIK